MFTLDWACDAQLPGDTNGNGLPSLGAALAQMGLPPLVEGGHTSRDLVAPPGSLGPPRGAQFAVRRKLLNYFRSMHIIFRSNKNMFRYRKLMGYYQTPDFKVSKKAIAD